MPKPQQSDEFKAPYGIVLFDGVCNFCNRFVNFVIHRNTSENFKFSALQSEMGQKILREIGMPKDNLFSLILIENGRVWTKSSAMLRILQDLPGLWPTTYILFIIPRIIRDSVYNLIARNRYILIGRSDACSIPSPEERKHFL